MSGISTTDTYSEIESPYYSVTPLSRGFHGPTVSLKLPTSHQTTPLAKLVCQTKLPHCVRLTKNFLAPGSHSRLKKGDVFLLHFVYVKPVINAIDTATGQILRLPLYARQEFEILPLDPQLDDKEYDGTASLIDAKPLPKFVRVVDAHCSSHPDEQQSSDDIITIDKIEIDKERGKVIVGTSSDPISNRSLPVRFSGGMTSASYTTMLFTEFYRLSQLKTHAFPQRVRIPDLSSGPRNKKTERVLRLVKYSEEKCVLATRSQDTKAYCLPLSAPLSLERTTLPDEKHLFDMMTSLHRSINTTWGFCDPTQGSLPPLLEEIPQPMEEVLTAWMTSWEGKGRMEAVLKKFDSETKISLTEKDAEIRQLRSIIESYKRESNRDGSVETPPVRPPRPARSDSMTLGKSIPAKPPRPGAAEATLTALDHRAPLSEPSIARKQLPIPSAENDEGPDSDEYEYVSDVSDLVERNSKEGEDKKVTSDAVIDNLKLKTEYDDLWNKYNKIQEENFKLQKENKQLVEKIEMLQNQLDDSEDYAMISDYAKPPSKSRMNYVKITSSKPNETKGQDTDQEKAKTPVSPGSFSPTKKDSRPIKGDKPVVPTRTNSRTSIRGPPVPTRRVSIDHTATTNLSKENITTADSQQIKSEPAVPAIPPKPSTPRASKLSDPLSSQTPDDPKPASSQDPPSSKETSFHVHSGLTQEEVGSFLKECNLGQYSETFIKNDVTGELLLALDEQIMSEELGMSRLHARKLSLSLKNHKSY